MNYEEFSLILNKHIFEEEKKELLQKLADNPERFVGLFRPTKPGAKILQHLLQSHEIRFGDAMEEIISFLLKELGFDVLGRVIIPDSANKRKTLDIDQYFRDDKMYGFIEQKVRDDHDSTKKKGQISNFEAKLEFLYRKHKNDLFGIIYFIDPDLSKNKKFYLEELKKMKGIYGIRLELLYGKELFEYFKRPKLWDDIIAWLKKWKDGLPELPEINFDTDPEESFDRVKELEIRYWRKILDNDKLWEEGIMKAISRNGAILRLVLESFRSNKDTPHKKLSEQLEQKLKRYF